MAPGRAPIPLACNELGVAGLSFAELVSLGMTIPTVVLAFLVVWTWFPSLWISWRSRATDAHSWFIYGVVIGFLGSLLDNIYWGVAWTTHFLGTPGHQYIFEAGAAFNIVFRQAAGVTAGLCHLKAAQISSEKRPRRLNLVLLWSHVAGALFSLLLLWLRG